MPLIDELLVLTDDVKPVPFEQIQRIVEETCGSLEEICQFVDSEPFAAASLSQVHKAILKDGTEVVFKVQRPDIRELIEVDLTILESLAKRAETAFPYLQPFNPIGLIEEFSQQMRKELDFVRDGKNAETIAKNLASMSDIKIPTIYWEYTSSRLLAMEYIEGTRIDNIASLSEKHDTKKLAEIGFQAYLQQIFIDGFFHGDPHSGNLKVTEEGKLVFFDFGMVGILRPERRRAYSKILYSIVSNDVDMLMESFDDIGITIDSLDIDRFKDEMYSILKETQRYKLNEYSFIDSMNEISSVFYRYKVRMPGSFMLMIKVVAMIGDIGLLLDPDFNFIERIQPHLNQLLTSAFFSSETIEGTRQAIRREVLRFPKTLRKFMENFNSGRSRMEVKVTEIDNLQKPLEKIGNKLFYGLVSMGLVIGLSIMISSSQEPLKEWISAILMVGGLALLLTILKGVMGSSEDNK